MATCVSTGNGLASAAGTWDTGVPVDGDTVTIGHLVEWDIDLSAGPTGITLAINGTLFVDDGTGAGSYGLMLAANMTGTGSIILSSDGTTSGGVLAFAVKRKPLGTART